MWFYGQHDGVRLQMTLEQARSASHAGRCDEDVEALLGVPAIQRQLARFSDEDLTKELRDYGAWDHEELADRDDNLMRLVWLAACQIREDEDERDRGER